jgi:Rrf2 family protein
MRVVAFIAEGRVIIHPSTRSPEGSSSSWLNQVENWFSKIERAVFRPRFPLTLPIESLIRHGGVVLGIKRETDYAVRTVLDLASLGDDVLVQVRQIAERKALPLPFVRRIVARLTSAGILATARGMGGGVRLARPAAEISLLDVVRAMEGGVVLNQCLDEKHTCPLARNCPAHRAWMEASAVLEAHLASIRFDGLARNDRRHVDAHRRIAARQGSRKAGRAPDPERAAGRKGRSP